MAEPQFKVMVAVDDSPQASDALQWYLEKLHAPNHFVILSHMAEPPSLPIIKLSEGLTPPAEEWRKIVEESLASVRRLEADYQQRLIHRKIPHKVRSEVGFTKPGEGIVNTATAEGADMIVMGTRGMGLVRRTVLGSVSDYVIRNAQIPVCVIPAKDDK